MLQLFRLAAGFASGALALVLAAASAHADTVVGLGPSTTGTVNLTFNGVGGQINVVLPSVLAGTGYEFDSSGTSTNFGPGGAELTPFSSSDQGTTLSLGGGAPTPVTWVDIGGDGLPGILILQFTTPLQTPGTYDDLVLNILTGYQPFIPALPLGQGGISTSSTPIPPGTNLCSPSIDCAYSGFVIGSGMQTTSESACGFLDEEVCTTDASDPFTVTANISSGQVYVAGAAAAPEPSTLSLFGLGLISLLGLELVRSKAFRV